MTKNQDEISTKTLVKEALSGMMNNREYVPHDAQAPCGKPECSFEKQKDTWLDSRFLKTAGVIIGLLAPLFAWIVIEIYSLKTELAVQKEKITTILEIKQDINTIKTDLQTLKSDVAVLKSRNP